MKRAILRGYVENRTKEAALAAMMLALFFVTRTYKIQVLPFFLLDLSGIFIFTSASILAWPYTMIFSFMTLYLASNPVAFFAYLIGTQTIFFLTKLFKRRWSQHLPFTGEITAWLTYGLILHSGGMMDFSVFLVASALPQLFCIVTTYFGGLFIWRFLRRVDVIG